MDRQTSCSTILRSYVFDERPASSLADSPTCPKRVGLRKGGRPIMETQAVSFEAEIVFLRWC
jgi:hypothetical protein